MKNLWKAMKTEFMESYKLSKDYHDNKTKLKNGNLPWFEETNLKVRNLGLEEKMKAKGYL